SIHQIVTHVCHPWINKYFNHFSFSLHSSFYYAWFRFLFITLFLFTNCDSSPIFYYLFISFISLTSNSESLPLFYFIWTYH
ncbi:hypothetical protein C1646_689430, partial [Rhizophagus diaphanus]